MEPLTAIAIVAAFVGGWLLGARTVCRKKITEEDLKALAEQVLMLIAEVLASSGDKPGDKPCEGCGK